MTDDLSPEPLLWEKASEFWRQSYVFCMISSSSMALTAGWLVSRVELWGERCDLTPRWRTHCSNQGSGIESVGMNRHWGRESI